MKRLIESAVGRPHAQGGVENQQRLAHRIDDVQGVVLNIFDKRSSFCHGYLSDRLNVGRAPCIANHYYWTTSFADQLNR